MCLTRLDGDAASFEVDEDRDRAVARWLVSKAAGMNPTEYFPTRWAALPALLRKLSFASVAATAKKWTRSTADAIPNPTDWNRR